MRFCWSHAFHYRATTLVALSKWKVGDWSHWFPGLPWYLYIYSQFFENQPNEICSHLSEKASKVGFFKPEKLQSHSNEGKGKEGKKKRREGKERKKKAMPALPVFIKKTVSRKWSIWRYMNHVSVCPSVHIVGCFLVLRKLLFVSFCIVVWVMFSVFSIFCITSLVSATPRNHHIVRRPLFTCKPG